MRQSQLFTKTRREAPSDEVSKNAEILIRAGFIHKEMSGVYSLLPLGVLVMNKIRKIVNEEMKSLGSSEILMSSLQESAVWQKTGRWDDEAVDVWFKTKLKNGTEVGLGFSHEEPITEMMRSFTSSYSDLPIIVHQFQNKFRNEVRAKSGVMRCREFLMKDMYAFFKSKEENDEFYNKVIESYKRIFDRIGIGDKTYVTSASGGFFTENFSHEFQTICDAGEDVVYVNKNKNIALNQEVFDDKTLSDIGMNKTDFEKINTVEVGNIFNFGNKKCEQMGLLFQSNDGTKQPVFLSSFGIGISRLMAVLVEIFGSDKSMVWPEEVAPYKYHIIEIISENKEVKERAENIYKKLKDNAIYDDRDVRAGEKFNDADLLGIPYHIIVSERNLAEGKFELKNRINGTTELVDEKAINL